MKTAPPPFVTTQLLSAFFDPATRSGRAYLSAEHRPYICHGISGVTFNGPRGVGLKNNPQGLALPVLPLSCFITLTEWGSMDQRFSRVPWSCTDAAANPFPSTLNFAGFPVFTCRPFLIDLRASYVDLPAFISKNNVVTVELALTPADGANLRAAGLPVPAVLRDPSNRLNR